MLFFALIILFQLLAMAEAKSGFRVTRFDGVCRQYPKAVQLMHCPNRRVDGGHFIVNCTMTVKEDVPEVMRTVLSITRCRSEDNPDTCEEFFKKDTQHPCEIYLFGFWKDFLDSFEPKLACPAKKGIYRSTNSIVDVRAFLVFPAEKLHWKIQLVSVDPDTGEIVMCAKRLNVLYEKNWTRLVTEQLKRFERAVIESSRHDGVNSPVTPHWTFGGALLYSLTLLTTVGYGRLSPRTTAGKAAAMIYAIVGVPLMLVLLSALGSLLAGGARRGYIRLCCKQNSSQKFAPSVGYHRAPSSPSGKHLAHSMNDDASSVQLIPTHCIQNNVGHKLHQHFEHHIDHSELPKRALLATVRSSHTRGRCVQGQVRQLLADPQMCPTHSLAAASRSFSGCGASLSDVEETDDNEDDSGPCSHDTPSRIPLIWRSPEQVRRSPSPPTLEPMPSVPAIVVVLFFAAYVCLGAVAFASTSGWSFLDAVYFCFIALSTIGIGDKLPQSADYNTQVQILACCIYLFFGLVVVAMCFSLVHEEVATKCKQFATSIRLVKH